MLEASQPTPSDSIADAEGANLYWSDHNLRFVLQRYLSEDDLKRAELILDDLGRVAGNELESLAYEADKTPPSLRSFDRHGRRIDQVVQSKAYRRMEQLAFGRYALASASHRSGVFGFQGPVPHVLKYAMTYLFAKSEFGLLCPVSMTDSLARTLSLFANPEIQKEFLPRLTSQDSEGLWQGAMFITEQSGGSDVAATETKARRVSRKVQDSELPEGLVENTSLWRLYGDKWFCSNVDAELILILARPDGAEQGTRGLGLFLVPRFLPDGRRNSYTIKRLKDKFGTRDMASGEVTLEGALAYQIGALENGFRQMAEMINASRLSNAVRSMGMMDRAFFESLAHARDRKVFGQPLITFPLMQQTLMEMLIDIEGCAAAVFYTAHRLEQADAGEHQARRLCRVLTPLLKATVTKRARFTTGEAMEVRGGNGYIEEWINPRLVRDSYLGSIWEGTTNIVQLDVLRSMEREGTHETLFDDLTKRLAVLNQQYSDSEYEKRTYRRLLRWLERSLDTLRLRCQECLQTTDESLDRARRELAVRRLVPDLFHLLASVGLAEEAGEQIRSYQPSARKLLVASIHVAHYLPCEKPVAEFGNAEDDPLQRPEVLSTLESLADWKTISEEQVEELGLLTACSKTQ